MKRVTCMGGCKLCKSFGENVWVGVKWEGAM